VGTGIATSVMTVANTLKDLYNSNSKICISGNYRIGDIRHNYADITLLKEKLQYCPSMPFEEGIKQFVAWVREQKTDVLGNSYEKSLAEMKAKGLYK
jgi:dTDP-L-rhamnose 4-epimerase